MSYHQREERVSIILKLDGYIVYLLK